jgi:hypothetical protein
LDNSVHLFVWYDRDCDDDEDIYHKCDYDVDVDVDENDDDDNDNHGKSDMNTTNIHKFWVTVMLMMITICHGDYEGDVDGCRKCKCDSVGGGCCDSDDDVVCKCNGDVDVEGIYFGIYYYLLLFIWNLLHCNELNSAPW